MFRRVLVCDCRAGNFAVGGGVHAWRVLFGGTGNLVQEPDFKNDLIWLFVLLLVVHLVIRVGNLTLWGHAGEHPTGLPRPGAHSACFDAGLTLKNVPLGLFELQGSPKLKQSKRHENTERKSLLAANKLF